MQTFLKKNIIKLRCIVFVSNHWTLVYLVLLSNNMFFPTNTEAFIWSYSLLEGLDEWLLLTELIMAWPLASRHSNNKMQKPVWKSKTVWGRGLSPTIKNTIFVDCSIFCGKQSFVKTPEMSLTRWIQRFEWIGYGVSLFFPHY